MKHLKRICFVVGVACFSLFGFGQDDAQILINLDFEDDTVGEQPEIIVADITPSPNDGTPAEEGLGFVVIDAASEPPNPLSGKSLYIYDLSEDGGVWLFLPFAGGVNRSEVRLSFDFQRAFAVEEGSDTRIPTRIYVVLGRVEDRLNRGNLQPFSLSLFNNGALGINAPRGGWPRSFNYNTDPGSVNKVDVLANSHDTDSVEYDLEDLGAGTVKPNSFHFFLNEDKMGEYDFHVAPDPNDPPEPRFNEQDEDLGKLLFFQGGRGKGGIVFDNISLMGISQSIPTATGKFINLSTRALVGTGDEVMIGGFIIREGRQQVVIQALGPELTNRGISNAMADPVLTVTNTTDPGNHVELMVNDNWEDDQGPLVSDLWGDHLPLQAGSLSSAAVLTLDPGNYTGKVEGKDGTTGVALIEVFEIDDAPPSDTVGKFINLSTRALVGMGDEVMIGGFIIREGRQQVLIQALGPELTNRGISNAMADPVLTVTNTTDPGNHVELMVNDNWEDDQGPLVSDLWGDHLPLQAGSLSSAAVLTLDPGNYTGKVEGKDGTTGVALIEVFEID